jgi:hypothetical protein
MRRIKAWALLASGTLFVLLALLSVASDAFEWRIDLGGGFYVPQSAIWAIVFMMVGIFLLAAGGNVLLEIPSAGSSSSGDGH